MASKLRRLISDHANLHTNGLPPNFLQHPSSIDSSDLTALSVYLAGPDNTPYSNGIFHLELRMDSTYPQTPPTAFFRTKIFHPNVDQTTGSICVETLKRDWKPELTLRDVLITINCLLVFPNPASALNAEAGHLMEEDFNEFEERASMWSRIHATIPQVLEESVKEAKSRIVDDLRSKKPKGKDRDRYKNQNKDTGHIIDQDNEKDKDQDKLKERKRRSNISIDPIPIPISTPLSNSSETNLNETIPNKHNSKTLTNQQDFGLGLDLSNVGQIDVNDFNHISKQPNQVHDQDQSQVLVNDQNQHRHLIQNSIRKRHAMLPPPLKGNSQTIPKQNVSPFLTPTTPQSSLFKTIDVSHNTLLNTSHSISISPDPRPSKRRRTHSLSPTVNTESFSNFKSISLPKYKNPLGQMNSERVNMNDPFSNNFDMPWINWEKFVIIRDKIDKHSKSQDITGNRRGIFRF